MKRLEATFFLSIAVFNFSLHAASRIEKKIDSIAIVNDIKNNDLGYKKFFATYYPKEFALKINGRTVKSGEKISMPDKTLSVEYHYLWQVPLWGTKKGAKRVRFDVPKDIKEVKVQFAGWQKDERILIPGAKKISSEEIIATK